MTFSDVAGELLLAALPLVIVVYGFAFLIRGPRGALWVTHRIVLPIIAAPFRFIAYLFTSAANAIHPPKKKKKGKKAGH